MHIFHNPFKRFNWKKLGLFALVSLFIQVSATLYAQETPEPEAAFAAGDVRVDEFGIEQVYVPAGCFMMGSTEEDIENALLITPIYPPRFANPQIPYEMPQHEVCLTSGYWIDRYEVTNADYAAFIEAGGYAEPEYWSEEGWTWRRLVNRNQPANCPHADLADHPRACVTWYEAQAYANWRGASLPTEAQWEFAARGEENFIFPWGNEWDSTLANLVGARGTVPVGGYPEGASWVGALDMSGNVMEWTADWASETYYAESERDDPQGAETGRTKVQRGGWWGAQPFVGRTTFRLTVDPPNYQDHHIGIRLVSLETTAP